MYRYDDDDDDNNNNNDDKMMMMMMDGDDDDDDDHGDDDDHDHDRDHDDDDEYMNSNEWIVHFFVFWFHYQWDSFLNHMSAFVGKIAWIWIGDQLLQEYRITLLKKACTRHQGVMSKFQNRPVGENL